MKLTKDNICSEEYIKKASIIKGNNRPYPMCVALGQIYNEINDPKIKLKLRYITTIAVEIATRLSKLDPIGIREVYPSYSDYDKLEKELL